MYRVRVWDLPTRLFHWCLVLSILGLVITGNLGGNWMNWHLRLGYTVFTLLLFRVTWGFVGGYWSRFSRFIYGPTTVLRYVKGQGDPAHGVGHSPLGALSVFAMLAVLAAQVGTGLFSDDDIAFFGPLVSLVSGDTVSAATWYHTKVGKLLVVALVALHVLALLYYKLVRRQALVAAMVHGDKELAQAHAASADGWRQRALAALVLLGCAGLVRWVIGLGGV